MNTQKHIVRDLVCKMELKEGQVRESFVYNGRTYSFCSIGCRAEFQRHPEEYAESNLTDQRDKSDV